MTGQRRINGSVSQNACTGASGASVPTGQATLLETCAPSRREPEARPAHLRGVDESPRVHDPDGL